MYNVNTDKLELRVKPVLNTAVIMGESAMTRPGLCIWNIYSFYIDVSKKLNRYWASSERYISKCINQ